MMDMIERAGPVTFPNRTDGVAFTGERYIPGITGELQYEHLHRYLFAMNYVAGREVLDIACGEGYGTAALAQSAASVLGVDIAADVVAHAAARYTAANVRFARGRLSAIPAADASFDIVICFETLEHVDDHDAAMREMQRVLRPDGILLISTPNSRAEDDAWHDANPFHRRELSEPEFRSLLSAHFRHVAVTEQRFLYGSIIVGKDDVVRATAQLFKPDGRGTYRAETGHIGDYYFVAAASNAPLPPLRLSVVDGREELRALRAEFKYAVETMHALQAEVERSRQALDDLQQERERLQSEIASLSTQTELHKIQIGFLRKKLTTLGKQHRPLVDTITERVSDLP